MSKINQEQKVIEQLLQKYIHETPDEALKKKIYDELSDARFKGLISIPFKVVLRKSDAEDVRDFVEVVLDTKL